MNMTNPSILSVTRFAHPHCAGELKHDPETLKLWPELQIFVAELCVRFNLSIHSSTLDGLFYLCTPDGFSVGRAYCSRTVNDNNEQKVIYHFYSPYISKSRGSDSEDKHTFRSERLPYLIAALKKTSACDHASAGHWFRKFAEGAYTGGYSYITPPNVSKPSEGEIKSLTPEDMLSLLEFINVVKQGQNPHPYALAISDDRFNDHLNHYRKHTIYQDAVRAEREKFKQCTVLAVDSLDQIVVAEVTTEKGPYADHKLTIHSSRRVPSAVIAEVMPDIGATLAMMRVAYEHETAHAKYARGALPVMDRYNDDLEILHYFRTSVGPFSPAHAFIAK
jgi:hypothetical protein